MRRKELGRLEGLQERGGPREADSAAPDGTIVARDPNLYTWGVGDPSGRSFRVTVMLKILALTLPLYCLYGCGNPSSATPAPAARTVIWQKVGEWSGRGNVQTESFNGDAGALRLVWQAKNETSPGAGRLKLTAHSAISGRPIQVALEHEGVGEGTAYVSDDPRVYFVEVQSENVDWSFTVEEGILATVTPPSAK